MYAKFAAIYDKLMEDVDRRSWANYIISLLPKSARNIVDAACGTGALTIPLKKAGFNVTGIDLSQEMLRIAAETARRERLDIPFVCQSMEKLSLHRKMDAIVSVCDGVNYLASPAAAANFFSSAAANLKAGGMLLFDVSSRYKLSTVLGNNTFAEDESSAAYIWKNQYDDVSKLIRMDLTFFQKGQGEIFERFTETHIQRAHSEKELRNWLSKAGFSDINVYDAFTMNAPNENSERIQFTAIAPGGIK